MSNRKAVVEADIDGFRTTDHERILACLTDDVVWDLPGYAHLEGKAAFDAEIDNEAFTRRPTLHLDRLVEEGDSVVAIGGGECTRVTGEVLRFVFADVFTFRDDLVCRLESCQVDLGD